MYDYHIICSLHSPSVLKIQACGWLFGFVFQGFQGTGWLNYACVLRLLG